MTLQFGTSKFDSAEDVAVDGIGNTYVAGITQGTLLGQAQSGWQDVFLRKYDPAGEVVWTRQFGSSDGNTVESIAVDQVGNVYLAGRTSGILPNQTSQGGWDAFLRKYDADGGELWTRQFGSGSSDFTGGVVVDSGGDVYVTGIEREIFVRKYDSGGEELWVRRFDLNPRGSGPDVAVDGESNVYVAGTTQGALPEQATGGPFIRKYDSAGTELWTRRFGSSQSEAVGVVAEESGNVYVASDGRELFVGKYDPAGDELWTREFAADARLEGWGIALDHAGRVYVVGRTYGMLPNQASAGSEDAYVLAYDSLGEQVWTRQFGSSEWDLGLGVAVDADGVVYVTGRSNGTLLGQTSAGGIDAFLVRLSSGTSRD